MSNESKVRVLVVDDQRFVGEILNKLLQKLGYESHWAKNWEEAEPVLNAEVDVVLLDLHMPEMSGYEFLIRIRELTLSQQPRVCAITGDATSASEQKVKEAGFDGFLGKPFTSDSLKALIDLHGSTQSPSV